MPRSAEEVAGLLRAAHAAGSVAVSARGRGHSTHGQALAPAGLVVEMAHGDLPAPRPTPVPDGGSTTWMSGEATRGPTCCDGRCPTAGSRRSRGPITSTCRNPKFGEFKEVMTKEFEMTDIGLMTYYLGIEVNQREDGSFISQAGYAREILKKFRMDNSKSINTPAECGVKLSKHDEEEKVDPTFFKSLVGSLRYLTCTRPDILYAVGLVSRYMEDPTTTHLKIAKRILRYIKGLINNWRSSFSSPRNPVKFGSVAGEQRVLYCLEMAKYYDEDDGGKVDGTVERLRRRLRYVPATEFATELTYLEFLRRVHRAEERLRGKGLWEVPHPWLNLFVPASRIADFDASVFRGILGNNTGGPVLIYPMNKHKWDERSSAVTPDEDVFYLVAFLRSALPDSDDPTQSLTYLKRQNQEILEFCNHAQIKIKIKQYLPHYKTQEEWASHFGPKWNRFVERKARYDPKCVLGSGQGIFQLSSSPSSLFPS
ncbi:hypothetical protein ZIOFF_047764 [Zingiber officinale]|uniref:Uncharacterized protein n=1 Tax=Zingiber officinale TaxID=94328 RepID=A0A8J5KRB6_ZINOF|nr:hypothetical protein ZIOFF_047764 [Zingiber officinale]